MEIYPQEEEAENLDDSDRFRRSEIVLCQISGGEKEYETDDGARDDLGDKRVRDEGFETCPIFLYDELRQEKIQTLGESEVMIDREETYEAQYTVQETDFLDREIGGEDDFHHISERSDEE